MSTPVTLPTDQAGARLHEFTVIDVRTPAEYATGHLPGAVNVPLDQVRRALPEIRQAARRGDLLLVCASGARSEKARALLTQEGLDAATLAGGTGAWVSEGRELERPANAGTREVWGMERQVRFTAGTLVLLGLVLGLFVHPAFQLLSAAVAGGLVFSALTDTCGMAVFLGKLPHNRPRGANPDSASAALRGE
ncbi:rhodanese-like domain-containing protein [Streptomyces sp. NPDC006147]|uniref:rhodanese-like domain-containing protein n=1 Tax=Streptomyces sp. NPDC006147 TaxID=3155597 RepID=UPI0033BB57D7